MQHRSTLQLRTDHSRHMVELTSQLLLARTAVQPDAVCAAVGCIAISGKELQGQRHPELLPSPHVPWESPHGWS